MNVQDIVVNLVALNDNQLIGRTRLQKQAYLLDRCGADFGLQFIYHRYGPYCLELAGGADDAQAGRRIAIEEKLGRHGVPYAIFKSDKETGYPSGLGKLNNDKARSLLQRMNKVSDIILELAATIVFLRDEWDYFGKGSIDPVDETKARKPLKATDERIGKALELLHDLDLRKQAGPATP